MFVLGKKWLHLSGVCLFVCHLYVITEDIKLMKICLNFNDSYFTDEQFYESDNKGEAMTSRYDAQGYTISYSNMWVSPRDALDSQCSREES